MEALDQLERNLHLLLERCDALERENHDLRLRNEDMREDAIRDKDEIASLRERVNKLLIARGLGDTDEKRELAKQQINGIIRKIDKALEIIKQ